MHGTALEQAERVRSGDVSAASSLEAAVVRAEAINPSINAIVSPDYEGARRRAAEVDPSAPLAGVPIVLKDLFCPVEGDTAYHGNRLLADLDWRYSTTGAVARRLAEAGTVSLGRSHSPEFGCGQCPAASETVLYGPTRNPWNLDHSPLGSTGGGAAAVAAGIVAAAHASDGGGSIRMPAAANGLVGLKPSRARISHAPAGDMWAGGATDGVITRTVADAAAFLDVLAGPEPGDPYWLPTPTTPFLHEVGRDPGHLRIGICTELPYAETDPECVAATRDVAQLLETLGHRVEVGHPAAMDHLDYLYDYIRVIRVSLSEEMGAFETAVGRPFSADDVEDGTWINLERGRRISGTDYVVSLERLSAFTRAMVAWWSDFDLLLTPTTGITTPLVGYLVDGDERTLASRLTPVTLYTAQFNATGQPAISLPLGWPDDGLPVGVQLVAAPAREDLLLRVSAQLEQAAPWADRYQVVH